MCTRCADIAVRLFLLIFFFFSFDLFFGFSIRIRFTCHLSASRVPFSHPRARPTAMTRENNCEHVLTRPIRRSHAAYEKRVFSYRLNLCANRVEKNSRNVRVVRLRVYATCSCRTERPGNVASIAWSVRHTIPKKKNKIINEQTVRSRYFSIRNFYR